MRVGRVPHSIGRHPCGHPPGWYGSGTMSRPLLKFDGGKGKRKKTKQERKKRIPDNEKNERKHQLLNRKGGNYIKLLNRWMPNVSKVTTFDSKVL